MYIKTKEDLKKVLAIEKKIYCGESFKSKIRDGFTKYFEYEIWKYIKTLRKTEYYRNNKEKAVITNILYMIKQRKKNKIGYRLGIEIRENSFESGLTISHTGNIVVNGEARIGKNCILHGDNCIGNNGKTREAPKIGDNVDIGVGAKIIGNIEIASNIKIGAGAVVVSSFLEEGITICGVPAKKVE